MNEADKKQDVATRLECVRSAVNHIASMRSTALTPSTDRDAVALAKQFYAFVTNAGKAEPVFAGRTDDEWREIQMTCPCAHCARARAEGRVK